MDKLLPVLGVFAVVFLVMGLVVRYAERAIAQRRPGWFWEDDEAGVRCPHATGHKGDRGEAGQEGP